MAYAKFYKNGLIRKILQPSLLPIAMISKFIPKKNGLEIYSSMNGYQIADNTKYAFARSNNKNRYWITKNKDLTTKEQNGFLPVYAYSFQGILLQLRAEKSYFTHSIFDFVPSLIYGSKKINLWHGVPLKEIGPLSDWKSKSKLKAIALEGYYKLFKHCYYMHCDIVACPDESFRSEYERFFRIPNPQISIMKQARNEFCPDRAKSRKILFAPTHRSQIRSGSTLETLNSFGLFSEKLLKFLEDNRIQLVIRPHPIDRDSLEKISLPDKFIVDTSEDLYDSIKQYPVIITDYSSIYYDCCELQIKCIIVTPDLENYVSTVGLTENYLNTINTSAFRRIEDSISEIAREFHKAIDTSALPTETTKKQPG